MKIRTLYTIFKSEIKTKIAIFRRFVAVNIRHSECLAHRVVYGHIIPMFSSEPDSDKTSG